MLGVLDWLQTYTVWSTRFSLSNGIFGLVWNIITQKLSYNEYWGVESEDLCHLSALIRTGSPGLCRSHYSYHNSNIDDSEGSIVVLTNDRTSYEFQSSSIMHYCWKGRWTCLLSNVSAYKFNQHFQLMVMINEMVLEEAIKEAVDPKKEDSTNPEVNLLNVFFSEVKTTAT